MKYCITILVLLFALNSFPQADLDIILTFITDEPQYNTTIINFGLDSTATDGIDPQLGEFTYPPDGCGGPGGVISCIAFWFFPPLFNEDIGPRDYRYGILPYSGQVEHRLGIALGIEATQVEMFWDFPEGVSVHLEDLLGGVLLELDMQGTGSFIFTESILNIFNQFQLIAIYDNVVPVELTSFTAKVIQNENAIELNWLTATETNNSGFEIQKQVGSKQSAVGNWKTIGFVPGFGTTTEPKSYSFTDENVTTGNYKYRLKQIDFDGTFTYLPIGQAGSNEIEIVVDFTPKEFVLYQNYPNPFNPKTSIQYAVSSRQFVTLIVFDILGNEVTTLVNEEKQPGVYEVEFGNVGTSRDLSLPSGIYFYQLKAGNFISTKKMVLLR